MNFSSENINTYTLIKRGRKHYGFYYVIKEGIISINSETEKTVLIFYSNKGKERLYWDLSACKFTRCEYDVKTPQFEIWEPSEKLGFILTTIALCLAV